MLPVRRLLGCVVVTCAAVTACASGAAAPVASSAAPLQSAASSAAPAGSATVTSAMPTSAKSDAAAVRKHALAEVKKIAAKEPHGSISVAALNTATGTRFVAGHDGGMWTASAYKLFVLEALMLRQGGPVYGYEEGDADAAIENSDNAAGYRLFLAAGGNVGLEYAAHKFGMKHTIPGASDPTFTRTSAADFLILVRNLVEPNSPLTPAARHFALRLMRDVEADQRWGVSAAADKGSVFYNKNGWLSIDDTNGPGETDDDRWAVTSVGIIQVHHQQVLMSIFTQHQPLMGDGVHLVERLAKLVAPVVAP